MGLLLQPAIAGSTVWLSYRDRLGRTSTEESLEGQTRIFRDKGLVLRAAEQMAAQTTWDARAPAISSLESRAPEAIYFPRAASLQCLAVNKLRSYLLRQRDEYPTHLPPVPPTHRPFGDKDDQLEEHSN